MSKVKRLVVGVTGGIASGKTTVMRVFTVHGIPTVSADDVAHACICRGQPAYRAVLRQFGREILGAGAQIDRKRLGKIIFANFRKRRALEKIIHPCVAQHLRRFIQKHHGLIALDIPLLFEAHYETWVDKVVVVYCSPAQQMRRLISRNHLTRTQALERIRAQMPLSQKRRKADIVLRNTGKIDSLRKQTVSLIQFLSHKGPRA